MNLHQNEALYAIRSMMKRYANGGVLLIIAAVLAMLLANTSLRDLYFSLWELPISLKIGDFNLFSHHGEPMTFGTFINDALMAIFFFSVGLEIKREVLVGELSSLRHALLPILGAIGGMVVPIIFFTLFSLGDAPEVSRGCAIPMATDIAFSLGVLAMLGNRVPIGLKIFLATLAVADDIGGILVIALFYAGEIQFYYLLASVGVILLLALVGKMRVQSKLVYFLLGAIVWYLFLQSGIHATIAGVIVAFCVPARPHINTSKYIERIRKNIAKFPETDEHSGDIHILDKRQISLLKSIESASDHVISPLQDMEDSLTSLINYVILPLFAFANAGVNLAGMEFLDIFQGVSLTVVVSLVLGKFLGIFSFSYLAVRCKIADIPTGATWKSMAGVALLGGVGFTVSMFIATLSYGAYPQLLDLAKLGILLGSLVAGISGYCFLNKVLPKETEIQESTTSVVS